ncbi:MAG: hypothetical protein U9M98_01375 [Patescibacteria group bacterium]|nr:hypothetical protein [Patescibacteria group bacterium]
MKETVIFLISFVLLALLSWKFSAGVYQLIGAGDSPEYIFVAESLIQDRDIFLENQAHKFVIHNLNDKEEVEPYAIRETPPNQLDLNAFYPTNVIPKDGHLLPYHPIGLSLLIAPAVAILGKWGAMLTINLCAALLALVFYKYTKRFSLAFLLTFSPPLLYLSLLCFNEIPTALIIFYIFTVIQKECLPQTTKGVITTALGLGFLPWLHPKYSIISGIFILYCIYKVQKDNNLSLKKATYKVLKHPITLTSIFSPILLFCFYQQVYGTWRAALATGHPGIINPLKGLLGLFLGREYGIILHAPLLLLPLGNILKNKKVQKKHSPIPPTIIGTFILGISLFGNWHGGVAPAGRLIAPAIPFLFLYFPSPKTITNQVVQTLLVIATACLVLTNFATQKTPGVVLPTGRNHTFQQLPGGGHLNNILPSTIDSSGKIKPISLWWE